MAYKKESGIYRIYCKTEDRSYIGQSRNLRERLYHHKYYLNKNTSHHILLQRAWDKYGEEDFTFEVLEYCNNLDEKEMYYVSKYNSFTNGYNTTTGGINGNFQDERQKAMRSIRFQGKNNPMYGRCGEKNPSAKLTASEVRKIKDAIKTDMTDKQIIDMFSISKSQYYKIKHNRTWKHI